MKKTIIALLFAAACGGKGKTPPTNHVPPEPPAAPTTAEECEAAGYTVVGDIGDGQVKCPAGTEEVSRIQYGIEGGVCCKPGAPVGEPVAD
jgi:hypothetical protein